MFQGTFNEPGSETRYDFTIHTDKGDIEILSKDIPYGAPDGLTCYGEVVRYFLRLATDDEIDSEDTSIVDVLDYLLHHCTSAGTYHLRVGEESQEMRRYDWDNYGGLS